MTETQNQSKYTKVIKLYLQNIRVFLAKRLQVIMEIANNFNILLSHMRFILLT